MISWFLHNKEKAEDHQRNETTREKENELSEMVKSSLWGIVVNKEIEIN